MSERADVLKNVYIALKKAQRRIEDLEREQARCRDIAIIGMACRFPGGANSPEAYWELLHTGLDPITEVPAERWDRQEFYDPDPHTPGKMYTTKAGYLSQPVDRFDAAFFNISPKEAEGLDPQQRLLLEVSWEAFEYAGVDPISLSGSQTGVFIGMSGSDYASLHRQHSDLSRIDAYSVTGSTMSTAAGRLAYFYGFEGPCFVLDTACSSALVGLHYACESLRAQEANLALVGAVNLILCPNIHIGFSKLRTLSLDGRCKTFDAAANGYVRSEGCGMALLKRLDEARADGDRILAVIRGSAVNQDGKSNGLTAPNGLAQEKVIRQAMRRAGVSPNEVQYIEAHGTGTALGDPIEMEVLSQVIATHHTAEAPLLVGAAKSNIGHMEPVAGLGGLLKVILALQHEEIPANLHLQNPSPHILWDDINVEVPTQNRRWPRENTPRIAGVSAFGFSGTNCHVIVQDDPERSEKSLPANPRPYHLLTLSARSDSALTELAEAYQQWLVQNPEADPSDVCYTTNIGRAHFSHRLALVMSSAQDGWERLSAYRDGSPAAPIYTGHAADLNPGRLAFLFTGQGAQYPGMGWELYQSEPVFRTVIDDCEAALRDVLDIPLLELLNPDGKRCECLHQTRYTQPALFALEYALYQLWQSWGYAPDAVMGHSVGEYVAACAAGVFSLKDGLRLIAARAALMQSLPAGGEMASVFAGENVVRPLLRDLSSHLAIAAFNTPTQTVLSGDPSAMGEVLQRLQEQGVSTQKLTVSHAFHSPLMRPIIESFKQVLGNIRFAPPQIPLISNVTGKAIDKDVDWPEYWVRHLLQPVRFVDSLRTLELQGVRLFLEIGPKPTLCGLGAACRQETGSRFVPSLKTVGADWEQLLQSLAELYCTGTVPDWNGLHQGSSGRRLTLPMYPFQRERYWVEGEDDPSFLSRVVYQIFWKALDATPLSRDIQPPPDEQLVMFGENTTFSHNLFKECRNQGWKGLWVQKSDRFCMDGEKIQLDPFAAVDFHRFIHSLDDNPSIRRLRIVFAWSLNGEEASIAGYLNLIRALAEASFNVQMVLLTRYVAPLPGEQSAVVEPASSPFWGLGRTTELEHAEWSVTVLDLSEDQEEVGAAAREILSNAPVHQVALRGEQRFVPELRGVSLPGTLQLPFAIKSDAIYLITGGLGSLGRLSAAWLVEKGARHLVLLGRQGLAASSESENGRGAQQKQAVQELEARGARVDIVQADLADAKRMQAVFNQLQSQGTLAGVIHAAGSLDTTPLHTLSLETYHEVTRGKLRGAQILHDLTHHLELDFMLFYSSVAALWGSPKMGHYAAANAYLDALAHHRTALGLPTLCVNWGAWEDSTMTDKLRHDAVLQQSGLEEFPQRYAVRILDQAVSQLARAQTVCARYDWNRLIAMMELKGPRHLFDSLRQERNASADASTSSSAVSRSALRVTLDKTDPEQREEVLLDYLRDLVCESGKFRDASVVSLTTGFVDFGLDSLMMMTMKDHLERDLGLTLRSTVTFDYPNLLVLCRHLLELLEGVSKVTNDPPLRQANNTTQETLPIPGDLSIDEIKSHLQDLLD